MKLERSFTNYKNYHLVIMTNPADGLWQDLLVIQEDLQVLFFGE